MLAGLLTTIAVAMGTSVEADSVPRQATTNTVYVGSERQLDVALPRIDATVAVDGKLDEQAWSRAAILTGFSQFAPSDGRPASDSTQVLVWYSATAMHFGIRAYEAHGAVNANLADRDRIFADDYVQIQLGTFNDRRQAFVLAVNPLGVQGDGVVVETGNRSSGGFNASSSGREMADLSANFVFDSKGRLTDYGYEVEIRVPFKSLRYQSKDPQDWGLHILRTVQHSGHEDSWAPARRAAASFLAQGGTLKGLSGLRSGLVLDFIPSVTSRAEGSLRPDGWSYEYRRPDVGMNVRWGVTNNLTLSGTANPDFSQVEADVGAVSFDPRSALFFPERRPFFLEGIEQFSVPNNLVYSRRIVQPVAAAKLTGKARGMNLALLSAVDDGGASFTSRYCSGATRTMSCANPTYNIVRLQRDLAGQSRIGMLYTDKIDGDAYNRVAALDARIVFARIWSARMQAAGSATKRYLGSPALGYSNVRAPLWETVLRGDGRRYGVTASLRGIHENFRTETGFISQPGVAQMRVNPRITSFGEKGSLFESTTFDVAGDVTWKYARFVRGEESRDNKVHFNLNATLRGGWRAGASILTETFGYDPGLYQSLGYYVERRRPGLRVDTVPFGEGTERLGNLDYLVTLGTPQFKNFDGNFFAVYGRDENFYEWASARIWYVTLNLNWRPVDQLRVQSNYQLQQFNRYSDGSIVGVRHIPRLKAEYQLNRATFFRVVGQYDMQRTDSLRDESRTGFPILIRRGSAYTRAAATENNNLRVDWLLSWQPNPGTVFFAGYGSTHLQTLDVPARRLTDLEPHSSAFFIKLSYLFRV
jgi:hypothetical protein